MIKDYKAAVAVISTKYNAMQAIRAAGKFSFGFGLLGAHLLQLEQDALASSAGVEIPTESREAVLSAIKDNYPLLHSGLATVYRLLARAGRAQIMN